MEVKKRESEEEITEKIEMPDVTGMTIQEATKTLKKSGLEVNIEGIEENEEEDNEKTVKDQLPKKGIQINVGTKVSISVK